MIELGVRELTYDERSKWGKCPVCGATHGHPCSPDVGIHLGQSAGGGPPRDGVHLGRLSAAPFRVRVVPA